jgi:hypothetical protein
MAAAGRCRNHRIIQQRNDSGAQPVHLWPVRCPHSGLPKSPRNASRTPCHLLRRRIVDGLAGPAPQHRAQLFCRAWRARPGVLRDLVESGSGTTTPPLRLHLTTSVSVTAAEHSARNRPCVIGAYPKSIPVVGALKPSPGSVVFFDLGVEKVGHQVVGGMGRSPLDVFGEQGDRVLKDGGDRGRDCLSRIDQISGPRT